MVLLITCISFPAVLLTGLAGAKLLTAIQLRSNRWVGKLLGKLIVAIILSAACLVEYVVLYRLRTLAYEDAIPLIAVGSFFFLLTSWSR
jgi:hypothetical protein